MIFENRSICGSIKSPLQLERSRHIYRFYSIFSRLPPVYLPMYPDVTQAPQFPLLDLFIPPYLSLLFSQYFLEILGISQYSFYDIILHQFLKLETRKICLSLLFLSLFSDQLLNIVHSIFGWLISISFLSSSLYS